MSFPEEGSLLWVDNLVIPANSPNKATAELFLNFLLRPEITGQVVNANYYAMPNDAAAPHIDPAILNDPVIYPADRRRPKRRVPAAAQFGWGEAAWGDLGTLREGRPIGAPV